jgi:hypothetical protein
MNKKVIVVGSLDAGMTAFLQISKELPDHDVILRTPEEMENAIPITDDEFPANSFILAPPINPEITYVPEPRRKGKRRYRKSSHEI